MSVAFVLDVGEMVMDIIGTSEGRKLTGRSGPTRTHFMCIHVRTSVCK